MSSNRNRRAFIRRVSALSLLAGAGGVLPASLISCVQGNKKQGSAAESDSLAAESGSAGELFFKISLAEWSLHRALRKGDLDNLGFPAKAKNEFGIDAVEYVNQFFMDKAKDKTYLGELKKRCDDLGVTSVRIMIDEEGDLGNVDEAARTKALENHYKWVEAAQFLGCTDIRVNARGEGPAEEVAAAAADGLGRLSTFAKDYNIAIIVENHGGYSSNGEWLAGVMKTVNDSNCGTLPDFGNFCIERTEPEEETIEAYMATKCLKDYDMYKGVKEMMPFAKGVSAKSYAFDNQGKETTIDYPKMMQIVKDAGYTSYVGIEYEGVGNISEDEGIRKTLELLKKTGAALS
ncbi:sugar phosphate isomerase/epimerase [Anseongella ginsenosidimutans]|uniref:Sugar phosphate isomerase/epimerase n=1 Tax=Anseongella ginsenosidimutans TaxID=496056 RepID=A0A4R3KSK2_9SPHI|nr:sugar phosphate isomerase/epimerase family protein [Anseongella ginsenosidimutans]QEC53203.1 TIM barrel protein [Anseongella ginsenosidimutans]TCS87833.1 sugar phosphate isomerase/epimerase [Anseongella ginsenosidimutans]